MGLLKYWFPLMNALWKPLCLRGENASFKGCFCVLRGGGWDEILPSSIGIISSALNYLLL